MGTGLHRAEAGIAAANQAIGDAVANHLEPAAHDLWRATAARADGARTAVETAATQGLHRAEEADVAAAGHAMGDAAASAWGSLAALGQRIGGNTDQYGAAPQANDHAPPARTLTAGR